MALNLIEEYGFNESGLLAYIINASVRNNAATLCAVEVHGLPIHFCCKIGNKFYIDAWGRSTEDMVVKRACGDLPLALAEIVELTPSQVKQLIGEVSEESFINAKKAAKQLFDELKQAEPRK